MQLSVKRTIRNDTLERLSINSKSICQHIDLQENFCHLVIYGSIKTNVSIFFYAVEINTFQQQVSACFSRT